MNYEELSDQQKQFIKGIYPQGGVFPPINVNSRNIIGDWITEESCGGGLFKYTPTSKCIEYFRSKNIELHSEPKYNAENPVVDFDLV